MELHGPEGSFNCLINGLISGVFPKSSLRLYIEMKGAGSFQHLNSGSADETSRKKDLSIKDRFGEKH